MKKIFTFLAPIFIVCLLFGCISQVRGQALEYPPDQLLIKFRNSAKTAYRQDFKRQLRVDETQTFERLRVEQWQIDFPVTLDNMAYNTLDDILPYLNMLPEIEYAEPDYYVQSNGNTPNDPSFPTLWGHQNTGQLGGVFDADIDAPEGWDIRTSSDTLIVGVLDTGIDWTHPDLVENIWQNLGEDADGDGTVLEWNGNAWIFDPGDVDTLDNDGNGYVNDFVGWDFINGDNDPMDDDDHGTHCAGIIGAKGNNGEGIVGVAWDTRMMGLKFMGYNGAGQVSDAIEALNYAVAMGARITNNSWGNTKFSEALYAAIQDAHDEGVLFVAAAGNDFRDLDNMESHYPASYDLDNIVSVAVTNRMDELANFSNYGLLSVDIAAPGAGIVSTVPNGGYAVKSGTSMGTPQVSGALALLWAAFPDLDHVQLKNKLLSTVEPLDVLGNLCVSGGRLNLFRALFDGAGQTPYTAFRFPRDGFTVYFEVIQPIPNVVYAWDFGDGNTGNGDSPTHTYTTVGYYDVCLIATNNNGADTTCNTVFVDATNCLVADSLELVNFYFATGGPYWDNSWELTEPVSTWYGVTVSGCSVVCLDLDGDGNCSSTDSGGNNLVGSMTDLNLPNLKRLYLSENELSGNLPNFTNLPVLEYLYLRDNTLSGNLPDFTNLPNLKELYLDRNQFSGTIPNFANLLFLERLILENNQLSGGIPNFSNLNELWELNLNTNQLSGEIPNFSLPSLWTLRLCCNELSGSIPNLNQNNLPLLSSLYIEYNQLSGSIPNFNLPNLQRLVMNWNQLSGSIPDFNNLTNLLVLNIGGNQLTGPIPNFSYSPNLEVVFLSYNQLSGNIPDFQQSSLEFIGLLENQLTGSIPDFSLPNLHTLEIGYNQLSDTIPDFTGTPSLSWLNLSNNELTGSIPTWDSLNSLALVYLDNNALIGDIPNWSNKVSFGQVQLNDNQLSGSIPNWINLPNLSKVYLDNNQLSGIVPDFSGFSSLYQFNISRNYFDFGDLSVNITNNQTIPDFNYSQQASIPLQINGNTLSIDVGGDLADNTYRWYRDGSQVLELVGDSTYEVTSSGQYHCIVENSQITTTEAGQQLRLTSDSIYYNGTNFCTLKSRFISSGSFCSGTTYTFINASLGATTYEWKVDNTIVSTDQNLTYTFGNESSYLIELKVTDGGNCQHTYSKRLISAEDANQLNPVSNVQFCEWGTLDAGIEDMWSYQWQYQGSILGTAKTQTVTEPGLYNIRVTDRCGNTASASINVTFTSGCVWPGDFNYDGEVTFHDLFSLGLAMGQAGPSRPNSTINWEGQEGDDWGSSSFLGINDKFCDGNGDGIVTLTDTLAMLQNYGLEHDFGSEYIFPLSAGDNQLFSVINDSLSTDSIIVIDIHLASEISDLAEVYALGFRYEYKPGIRARVDFSNSVLGEEGVDFIGISKDYPEEGYIEMSATRITGTDTLVNGPVCRTVVTVSDLPNGDFKSWIRRSKLILSSGDEVQTKGYNTTVFSVNSPDSTIVIAEGSSSFDSLAFYINYLPYSCEDTSEAEVFMLNGVSPYTYQWSSGQTTAQATNLGSGLHYVTVADAQGCSRVGYVDVGYDEDFRVLLQTTDAYNGLANGTATVIVLGDASTVSYQWDGIGIGGSTAIGLAEGAYQVTVTSGTGCEEILDFKILGDRVSVQGKAFLQGAYDTTTSKMRDDLRQKGYLPSICPYDASIMADTTVFEVEGYNALVDWVQVELRDGEDSCLVVATQYGFIQRDGDVVGIDGVSALLFEGQLEGYYHVVLRHSNHLPVRTSVPVLLTKSLGEVVDFRRGEAYVGTPMHMLADGTSLLIAGNANGDNKTDVVDRDMIWDERNSWGYQASDCNLDGVVNSADRVIAWNNRNYWANL